MNPEDSFDIMVKERQREQSELLDVFERDTMKVALWLLRPEWKVTLRLENGCFERMCLTVPDYALGDNWVESFHFSDFTELIDKMLELGHEYDKRKEGHDGC